MPLDPSLITPKAPAAAAPLPAPAPAEPQPDTTAEQTPEAPEDDSAQTKGIPKDVLQIPAFQALLAGNPAAVSAPIAEFEKRPEAKLLIANKDVLMRAGFGFYRSLDGAQGTLFNQMHIHGADIQAADKAGQLLQVAPPFDQVNDNVSRADSSNHPLLQATAVPNGPKGPSMPSPPQSGSPVAPMPPVSAAPAPASIQNKLATARLNNLAPQGPTSGSNPGSGALLRSILKPVV